MFLLSLILTKITTSVFNPKGELLLSREKGIFRNWDSAATLMKLPEGLKGNYICKETRIKTPQILPNFSTRNRDDFISIQDSIFRPTGGEGMSLIQRTHFDNYGNITSGNTKYYEPIKTIINPEKHVTVQKLLNLIFGVHMQ